VRVANVEEGLARVLNPRRLGVLGLILVLGGCTAFESGSQYQLTKDILKLENKVDKLLDQQQSNYRKVEGQLGNLDTNLETRGAAQRNATDDMERLMREIQQEMNDMKGELEALTVQLNSMSNSSTLRADILPERVPPADEETADGSTPGATLPYPAGDDEPQPGSVAAVDQAISQALHQFNLGQYEEALVILKQARDQNPSREDLVVVLFWTGESHFSLEDYDAAFDAYQELIKTNNSSPKAWLALEQMANIRYRQEKWDEALELLSLFDSNENYDYIDRVRDLKAKTESQKAGGGSE